ncbi:alpha/beta hydrolase [Salisediminibacterium beveridgei]|uniref:Alpha/beta hydrolase fold-5 domain-containing protein n=1 Tax=Salisediminibacterium beveridgei TaxID=632773 RepID=A0A1D7QZ36_9BACI|nr:alpha/beta hydrolase [Salisediminibacterium beveridgei]AOM84269.1 hypothetical protein BBEV_2944 [Salisediminibacterium beveridgei]
MAVIWENKWKILLGIILAVIAIVWFILRPYPAGDAAKAALEESAVMEASVHDAIRFIPDEEPLAHLIYYPGGLVEEEAYSYFGEAMAEAGVDVWIIPMPLNLAVLGSSRAEGVLESVGEAPVVIGGHSLGGAMASRFAQEHAERLAGVFFHGAYPDEGGRLDETDLSVLLITAQNDEVMSQDSYREGLGYLSAGALEEEIIAGNHASFGDYGPQRGDGEAGVTHEDAVVEIVDITIEWLTTLR